MTLFCPRLRRQFLRCPRRGQGFDFLYSLDPLLARSREALEVIDSF
jgi:hypothetical protein